MASIFATQSETSPERNADITLKTVSENPPIRRMPGRSGIWCVVVGVTSTQISFSFGLHRQVGAPMPPEGPSQGLFATYCTGKTFPARVI